MPKNSPGPLYWFSEQDRSVTTGFSVLTHHARDSSLHSQWWKPGRFHGRPLRVVLWICSTSGIGRCSRSASCLHLPNMRHPLNLALITSVTTLNPLTPPFPRWSFSDLCLHPSSAFPLHSNFPLIIEGIYWQMWFFAKIYTAKKLLNKQWRFLYQTTTYIHPYIN